MNKLWEKISAVLARPVNYVTREWARLSPRERGLVGGLGLGLVAIVTLGGGFMYFQSIADQAEQNADMREALATMARHRDTYLDAKAKLRAQEQRIGSEPPQLAADLESAARDAGVQIPETNERPDTPVGKSYLEHNVDLKLRQVDLQSLSKFLLKLETGQRLIVVTRLEIRRRFSEGDKLDVDMTATAYEKLKQDKIKKGKGSATKEKA